VLNHLAHRTGRELAPPEQLQDAAAHRITKYVERVHQASISETTYISECF
jgi:hypothetical protein